jgi:hypothetical protein
MGDAARVRGIARQRRIEREGTSRLCASRQGVRKWKLGNFGTEVLYLLA